MASAAQWERRIIGQRTKDALAVRKEQGREARSSSSAEGRARETGRCNAAAWDDAPRHRPEAQRRWSADSSGRHRMETVVRACSSRPETTPQLGTRARARSRSRRSVSSMLDLVVDLLGRSGSVQVSKSAEPSGFSEVIVSTELCSSLRMFDKPVRSGAAVVFYAAIVGLLGVGVWILLQTASRGRRPGRWLSGVI